MGEVQEEELEERCVRIMQPPGGSSNPFGEEDEPDHRHCRWRGWEGGGGDDGPDGREIREELQGSSWRTLNASLVKKGFKANKKTQSSNKFFPSFAYYVTL